VTDESLFLSRPRNQPPFVGCRQFIHKITKIPVEAAVDFVDLTLAGRMSSGEGMGIMAVVLRLEEVVAHQLAQPSDCESLNLSA
jgi:hypothetical protein